MRVYRLYNLTELGPASGLHFFKRSGAEAYKDLVKWPYADSGRWPLAGGGSVPLDKLELRIEDVERPYLPMPALDAVLWEQGGKLGWAPLLPGDCFDPDEWQPYGSADFGHPNIGPQLEEAWRQLQSGA